MHFDPAHLSYRTPGSLLEMSSHGESNLELKTKMRYAAYALNPANHRNGMTQDDFKARFVATLPQPERNEAAEAIKNFSNEETAGLAETVTRHYMSSNVQSGKYNTVDPYVHNLTERTFQELEGFRQFAGGDLQQGNKAFRTEYEGLLANVHPDMVKKLRQEEQSLVEKNYEYHTGEKMPKSGASSLTAPAYSPPPSPPPSYSSTASQPDAKNALGDPTKKMGRFRKFLHNIGRGVGRIAQGLGGGGAVLGAILTAVGLASIFFTGPVGFAIAGVGVALMATGATSLLAGTEIHDHSKKRVDGHKEQKALETAAKTTQPQTQQERHADLVKQIIPLVGPAVQQAMSQNLTGPTQAQQFGQPPFPTQNHASPYSPGAFQQTPGNAPVDLSSFLSKPTEPAASSLVNGPSMDSSSVRSIEEDYDRSQRINSAIDMRWKHNPLNVSSPDWTPDKANELYANAARRFSGMNTAQMKKAIVSESALLYEYLNAPSAQDNGFRESVSSMLPEQDKLGQKLDGLSDAGIIEMGAIVTGYSQIESDLRNCSNDREKNDYLGGKKFGSLMLSAYPRRDERGQEQNLGYFIHQIENAQYNDASHNVENDATRGTPSRGAGIEMRQTPLIGDNADVSMRYTSCQQQGLAGFPPFRPQDNSRAPGEDPIPRPRAPNPHFNQNTEETPILPFGRTQVVDIRPIRPTPMRQNQGAELLLAGLSTEHTDRSPSSTPGGNSSREETTSGVENPVLPFGPTQAAGAQSRPNAGAALFAGLTEPRPALNGQNPSLALDDNLASHSETSSAAENEQRGESFMPPLPFGPTNNAEEGLAEESESEIDAEEGLAEESEINTSVNNTGRSERSAVLAGMSPEDVSVFNDCSNALRFSYLANNASLSAGREEPQQSSETNIENLEGKEHDSGYDTGSNSSSPRSTTFANASLRKNLTVERRSGSWGNLVASSRSGDKQVEIN
ncbi:MAG: hypothetical protein ABW189_05195 [Rickettsiales bacterium]